MKILLRDSLTGFYYGVTWTQTTAPGEYWRSIASSSNGTMLAAGVYDGNGGIWTYPGMIQTTTTPGTVGYLAGGQDSAIELLYIGSGQFMPLGYVGTIFSR